MNLKRAHLIVGLLGLAAFIGTGQYMHWVHAHLVGMADAPRMIYRSTHIYLLFASALNIVLGVYFVPDDATPWRHRVQQLGSALILAAPLLLLAAFFREPWLQNFERPLTRPAVYAVFAGTLLHLISSARTGKR